MNIEKYIESFNFEKGKDARYYIDYLNNIGVKVSDNTIEKKVARYHMAKYGIVGSQALLNLVIKYDLDKKMTLDDAQKKMTEIYFNELKEVI